MKPLLSILTPAVPSRFPQVEALTSKLTAQIGDLPVEHLVLLDNKRRTVGEKRDALLRIACGEYVAYVDDDDDVSADYVAELMNAIKSGPDVLTFIQHATVDDTSRYIEFKLGNPNEPWKGYKKSTQERPSGREEMLMPLLRNAWHVCAWRRSLAIQSGFPANSYGEDWAYAAKLCALPNLREVHIPKVLHYYRHSSATTEAPPPL